jgi:signal transduction histidine kinase
MRAIIKSKSTRGRKAHKRPAALKRSHGELHKTAQTLSESDLKLHQANERFNQQIGQLQILHRLGAFINTTFDIEEILHHVVQSLAGDLNFEKSGIVFLEKKGQKPMESAYFGFSSDEFTYLLEHFDDLIRPVLARENELALQSARDATAGWSPTLSRFKLSSLLILPMRVKTQLIGFIVAGRSHGKVRLSHVERQFYCMYASQVSGAIENARLYEALGQANLTLEEKIQERTQNLIDANERLRELDTAKSNFISLISHELRTPLTSIKGFAMMLFLHDKDISDDKRRIYLSVLNEETDRLTRLITELLDISRIESGRLDFKWQWLAVPDIVHRLVQRLKLDAKSVEITTDFQQNFPAIVADLDKFEQVIVNLITNAVRFSPENGKVVVRGRTGRDGVTLEIADQGMGIAFSEQERIFDKFYRLDNDINRKNPGTGLGLPICRALVNLHGGKIWVESEPGQGSRFLISLPINADKLPDGEQKSFASSL